MSVTQRVEGSMKSACSSVCFSNKEYFIVSHCSDSKFFSVDNSISSFKSCLFLIPICRSNSTVGLMIFVVYCGDSKTFSSDKLSTVKCLEEIIFDFVESKDCKSITLSSFLIVPFFDSFFLERS